MGSYDAIRVYLWAGMTDSATADAQNCLGALPAMARYLNAFVTAHAGGCGGVVVNANGPVGFSAGTQSITPTFLRILCVVVPFSLLFARPGRTASETSEFSQLRS